MNWWNQNKRLDINKIHVGDYNLKVLYMYVYTSYSSEFLVTVVHMDIYEWSYCK